MNDVIVWTAVVLAYVAAAASVFLLIRTTTWIRKTCDANLEVSAEIRLVMEDLITRDPQIAEQLEVALLNLDENDRAFRRLRQVSSGRILWGKS